jgi:hypothetical protein
MLERAVAAVKEDEAKALDMFNNGEGGFKDRDLYVWCANASEGIITAQPYMNKGKQLRDIKGKHGAPFGETIMQNATEGPALIACSVATSLKASHISWAVSGSSIFMKSFPVRIFMTHELNGSPSPSLPRSTLSSLNRISLIGSMSRCFVTRFR